MVILHVTGMNSSKYGGLERFFISLIKSSSTDKHVLVYENKPTSTDFINDVVNSGGEVVTLPTYGGQIIKNVLAFGRLIRKYKPNIVHFHFGTSFALYSILLKCFSKIKIIKTEHCCLTYMQRESLFQCKNKSELSKRFRLLTLDGYCYRFIDKVLFVSYYQQTQFLQVLGVNNFKSHQVIYLGTPGKTNRKLFNNNSKSTIILSTILFASPIKGLDILLRALPYVQYSNFKLNIIGMDEAHGFTKKMHQLAQQLHVDSKLSWVGITDNVYRYLSETDIYIQPSRTEALPLSIMEAMSSHLPVIASNVGGNPELTDVLFEVENSKDLASKINLLIGNEALRENKGNKSYDLFERELKISIGIQKYYDVYKDISKN